MNATPMRLVIAILGSFGGSALLGAITLSFVRIPVPDQLWMIVIGTMGAIGGLLANPRSGAESRSSDSRSIPIEEVASIEVEAPSKKK